MPESHAELVGSWYWGNSPYRMTSDGVTLSLTPHGGEGGFRFEQTGSDTYRGLAGYQNAETMRVVRRVDGTISHLDLGTFCYTRVPYDPAVDYPGRGDEPVSGPR